MITLMEKFRSPQILVADAFLSPTEARQLINEYEGNLSRSTLYGDTGVNEVGESRSSFTAFLPPGQPGSVLEAIEKRASDLLQVPLEHLETLQLVRYGPSQKYDAHWDYFTSGPEMSKNRTKTALVYLNDLEEGDVGGGTLFPKLDLEVRPTTGRVVVWHNCDAESGRPAQARDCDHRTLHAGAPPERSTKFALNVWARNQPAR